MNITERLTDTVNKPLLNKLVVTGWKSEEGKGMIVVGDKMVQTQGRSQDGGGVGQGEHFLPHKFIKRAFKRRVNSIKQLLNAGRGHQAPRKAIQLFERR